MKSLSRGHVKAGLDSVRGAKLRTFWTTLGVIIGVTSVITVVGIGEGIKQQIGGQIHHLGQNLITVRPAQFTTSGGSSSGTDLISGLNVGGTINLRDIDIISETKGVAASAPLTLTSGTVRGVQGAYHNGFVIGTSSDLPALLNQSIAYGSFFGPSDGSSNVAVLGQNASDALFDEDVPLGRSFTFHGQSFIVRGIFNQFTTTPLSRQVNLNDAIFIPNNVAENLTNQTASTYEVLARPKNARDIEPVMARLGAALNAAHGGQSNLSVQSGNQDLTASDGILELLTKLIAGVAAISLLVGGIGIMNVMLVSVAERTHEIGIRKAVGATNTQVLGQFMMEATILSLAGGLIGILLAFLIDLVLRAFTNVAPSIQWQIVLLAAGVSFIEGIVFGTIPAVRAARKNPIEALRSE